MGSNISQADLNFLRDWIRNFYNCFEHYKWNIIQYHPSNYEFNEIQLV